MTSAEHTLRIKKPIIEYTTPSLSLIVPCHNESYRIFQLLKGLRSFIKAFADTPLEIILVNAASSDSTLKKLSQIKQFILDISSKENQAYQNKIKIIDFKMSGKGAAINEGIRVSSGKWVFLCDADFPLRKRAWSVLRSSFFQHKNADFICGLRKINNHSRPKYRQLISQVFRTFSNKIVLNKKAKTQIKDPQCCIKIIKSDLAKNWAKQSKQKGFLWDLEWLRAAVEHRLTVASIPLSWNDPYKSHINWFVDPIRMFIGLFELRYQDSFYLPESYILGNGFEH